MSKKKKHLWDTQVHLQMIEETQATVDEEDSHEDFPNDEKDCEWIQFKHMDFWNDEWTMGMLNGGHTPTNCSSNAMAW